VPTGFFTSFDAGATWVDGQIPMRVGNGAGIGPANNALFFDKEWLTVDNFPASPLNGSAYLVAARYLNGLLGSYKESKVYFAFSDDGGRTWSTPREISGSNPLCSFQNSGPTGECDEDSFPIPEVAPNGNVIVHFQNGNVETAWETPGEYESTLMAVKSTNGGSTFGAPVVIANLEDGAADAPWSVIGRQTVTGHQIRWQSPGTITADPTNVNH
jgi:Neuraminidase (sialidase)